MSLAEPTDDGDGPPGEAAGAPPGPVPAVGTSDGGVSRRVSRRCRTAAAAASVLAGACLLVAAVRPQDLVSGVLVLLAAAAVLTAAVLVRRSALWTSIASATLPTATGQSGTVGAPQPLSPPKPGAPLRRRIGAWVVPVHATDGPQPGAGALVVHARTDGITLTAGDRVRIWRAGRAGAEPVAAGASQTSAPAGDGEIPAVTGRFVLRRESDGEVFLGTTRLTDTW
ncbi:hypothetical protein ACVBEQ_27305 [Nakamurella sp. GG22]